MIMCQVKCSELRDYWSPKSFTFNAHIAELFTYERFCALLRNLHFANNAAREDGGDQPTAEAKQADPKLRNWKIAKVRCVRCAVCRVSDCAHCLLARIALAPGGELAE
jgi:hypothetical protein